MAQNKTHKEDVIRSLLESMKQAVGKKTEPNGTNPTKKPRDLPSPELEIPETGQWPIPAIKGDFNKIVDWVNEWPCQDQNEGKHRGRYPKPFSTMVGSRKPLTTANHRVGHTHLS